MCATTYALVQLLALWEMTSGLSPYSALRFILQRIHAVRQSTRLSGRFSHYFSLFPHVVSVFSAEHGSTADTCSASVYEAFWKDRRFYRFAWFHSGYKFMRHMEAGFAIDLTPRAVLFFPLNRPMMRCIMAGMTQKDSRLRSYVIIPVVLWRPIPMVL